MRRKARCCGMPTDYAGVGRLPRSWFRKFFFFSSIAYPLGNRRKSESLAISPCSESSI
nr:hypothetical protein [uncultured bacterium]